MLDLIKEAFVRQKGVVTETPLVYSSSFSKLFGFECWFKLENLQKTGSFKARGAFNRISCLTNEEKKRGVITASSGNHAQAVAWASSLVGTESTIVMPETAPIIKQVATRGYGGLVILYGRSFDEALSNAMILSKERNFVFIPPFEDDYVIAGQGTIGLEIINALPSVDAVIAPIGGGGLISGIASYIKAVKPGIEIIGVEAMASPSCSASFKAGRPVAVEKKPTVADGVAIKKVGEKTFGIIKSLVDGVVAVSEDAIASAILRFLERKKLVVEGAGALTLAAAIEGKVPQRVKKAVFIVSGGNIDVSALDKIIRLGLLRDGRVIKVLAVIPDVPGALAELTAEIATQKANILHVAHRREADDAPVGSICVEVILEVEGRPHGELTLCALKSKGYVP